MGDHLRSTYKTLHQNEKKFRALFEQAGDYILILEVSEDGGLVIVDANRAACEIHGYTREEFLGITLRDLDKGLGEEQVRALTDRILSGESVMFETAHAKMDGTIFPVEVSAKNLDSGAGMPLIVSIERDITGRKEAEKKLLISGLRFDMIIKASGVVVWDWNIITNELDWDNTYYQAFGYSQDDTLPTLESWTSFIHPEDAEHTLAGLYRAVESGEAKWESEYRFRKRDGTYAFTLDWGTVIHDENGKPVRMIGAMLDITERKRSEAEQARLQRELQQVQKMEALGQLTGGIAHDFNNILGIIMGYSDLARDRCISKGEAKLTSQLDRILEASGRARDLVSQMMAFSRGDARDDKPLQLQALVKEDLKMLSSTLPSSIGITTEIEENLPSVIMDPGQLNQLLMNLCVNARDAMKGKGDLTIRIGWVRELDAECATCHKQVEGDWVELSVTDTGSGISQEVLNRIFDPFFTTKEVGKGTGMGMAVIHGIMRNHGGHILVETGPGEGTTFRLLFPPVVEETAET
ncbi:MAG: PAS domain S-box protein [Gammaproteobacteria bacterium]|nr:PAS domain S-box protein [Gammaproteobacteria bacterium]